MRILHLLDTSRPNISGYSSRSWAIVKAQRDAGLSPIVLTSPRYDNPDKLAVEEIDGIPHYRTLAPRSTRRLPIDEVSAFRRRIVDVARDVNADVLHAHSPILTGIPAWLAARKLGIGCVYEMRSLWEDAMVEKQETTESSLKYKIIRSAETFLMRRVDGVVCICEGLRKDIAARGIPDERITVVPNGVDVSRFDVTKPDPQIAAELGLQNKVVVGYIGTFFGFEGVPDLVEAIALLIQEGHENLAGLIVGRGTTYEECRGIAESHGLADRIVHPGHVPSDKVEGLYSVMDVLAYPRRPFRITELVTPLKPLEAMAMQKATIGSDVGGIGELIQPDYTGLVHKAGNVRDLADKIRQLLNDPDRRESLARQGRDWVAAERSWAKLVTRYNPVYEALAGRRQTT